MSRYKVLYDSAMLQLNGFIDKLTNGVINPTNAPDFNTSQYNQMLIAKDTILCSNRYLWKNLPFNLTSQQLESLFYRYGSLCFFVNDKGNLLASRYSVVGTLQPFGRLEKIIPIDFAGRSYGEEMSVITSDGNEPKKGDKVAIIINDYTADYSDIGNASRYLLNKATTINDQVLVYRQLRTNIILSVKKALAICDSEEQKQIVTKQIANIIDPSSVIVPITNKKDKAGMGLPIEMWNFENNFDTQNYCQQIDYYDKVRRSFNGIPAPDTFEKKERKVVGETEDTTTHTELVLLDGYLQRFNGLELMKKYIQDERLKSVTVEIQPTLIEKEEDNSDENDEDDKQEKDKVKGGENNEPK